MNAVIYHSNTGESKRIAEYLSELLSYELCEMGKANSKNFKNAVVVFPVHCQSIPKAVRPFLKALEAEKTVLIATYGKMSHGNALYECQKHYGISPVAAAYIPTKHSYLSNDTHFHRFGELSFVKTALEHGGEITIPKSFKNPLSVVLPSLRSRLGVRLIKGSGCNNCGLCRSVCENSSCTRCLKCISVCPQDALSFRLSLPMKLYLKKKKFDKTVIYKG